MKQFGIFLVPLFMLVFVSGCQKYDPVETLKATVKVSVYFSPDPHNPCYDWYKGKSPDPRKHRQVVYEVTVTNTGKRNKSFILIDPLLDPSFKKLVINSCGGLPGAVPPGKRVTLDRIQYLVEGNPSEIEKLVCQSKVRIVWEEGGKKWEKIVNVTPEK